MSPLAEKLLSKGAFQALRYRNFALYAPFSFLAANAYWIHRIAIQWLVWELTGSYIWLGTVALCEAIAIVSVMPAAGILVDQMDRVVLAKATRGISAVTIFLIGVFSYFELINLPLLISFISIVGLADGVWTPTRLALVPSLVPKDLLHTAISFEAASFHSTQFLGPALAGVLIAYSGVSVAFMVSGLLITSVFVALFLVQLESAPQAKQHGSMLSHIQEGLSYLRQNSGMLRLLLFATLTGLCLRPYREFYAGFAEEIFHLGPDGLAMLASLSGAGAIIATIFVGSLDAKRRLTSYTLVMATIALGSMILLSLAPTFFVALCASAGLGFSLTAFSICAQILLQRSVEDSKRGRVMSLWGLQLRAIPSIGGFLIGCLAGMTDIRVALLISCILFVILSVLAIWPERQQIQVLEQG